MDSKEAAEEFIRRESKADVTQPVQLEFKETEVESEFKQPEVEPAFKATEVEQEFTSTTRTEFDAIHPRFRVPKKKEAIEEYQEANDYYCEQCKLYFAPNIVGLKTHFKGDMVQHQPIEKCFYCEGPVYGYIFNSERQIYHNCEDVQDTRPGCYCYKK